jgi:hypothetical protein
MQDASDVGVLSTGRTNVPCLETSQGTDATGVGVQVIGPITAKPDYFTYDYYII